MPRTRLRILAALCALVFANSASACDNVLVTVAANKSECIKPGSGESFKDCDNCPEMVVAPAGSFVMGSPSSEAETDNEGPQHEVHIAKPFAVGRFAVTRDEFGAFVKDSGYKTDGGCNVLTNSDWKLDSTKSWRSPGYAQTNSHPVVCVNWDDAKAYVTWLSKKTGKEYQLLSEGEREYVTRAGTTTPFWWGETVTTDQANYNGNYLYDGGAKGEYRKKTLPVKSLQPNPWGLYQVHGNVWEWVEDCSNDNYEGAPADGSAWLEGNCALRVQRGGSWDGVPWNVRSARRAMDNRGNRYDNVGFRCARVLK